MDGNKAKARMANEDKTNQTGVADKVALIYRGQDPLKKMMMIMVIMNMHMHVTYESKKQK